jgi:hypothetical protein
MAAKTHKTFVDPFDPIERGMEAVRSLGQHTKKGVQTEAGASASELLAQLFGGKKTGESSHKENQAHAEEQKPDQIANGHVEIFDRTTHHKAAPSENHQAQAEKAHHPKAEAAINYHQEIVKNRERMSKGETNEMRQNIVQIKAELSKLVASSQVLKMQFAEVSVEQTVNVGRYQLNFFEWMLAVIRSARQKVEDSEAWLGTVQGKGAKKDYWSMFKKHGTTFGLSGERSAATSVG